MAAPTHSTDVIVLAASNRSHLAPLPEDGEASAPHGPSGVGPPLTVAVTIEEHAQPQGSEELTGTTVGSKPRPRIVIPPTTPARKRRYSRNVSTSMRAVARAFLPKGAVDGESYRFVRDRNWVPSSTPVARQELTLWSSDRVCAYYDFTVPLRTQLFLVAVFPFISLAIGISPFLVPYGNMDDGPGANSSFFVSLFIGAFLVYFAPMSMVSNLTKIPVDNVQRVAAAAVSAFMFAGSAALGGHLWTWPVPFVVIIGAFPGFIMCVVLVYFMVPKRLRTFSHTRTAILKGMGISVLALGMMLAWAGVRVAFVRLRDGHWQTLVCITIPFLKMLARELFVQIAMSVDSDLAPSFTFIVEYFNGIFSTTMLASATVVSGMILVSMDAALNIYKTYLLCTGKKAMCSFVVDFLKAKLACGASCRLWCRCFSCFSPCPTSSVKPVSRSSFHVKLPELEMRSQATASTAISSVGGSRAVPATPGAVSFDFARSRASTASNEAGNLGEATKSASDVRQGTRSPPSSSGSRGSHRSARLGEDEAKGNAVTRLDTGLSGSSRPLGAGVGSPRTPRRDDDGSAHGAARVPCNMESLDGLSMAPAQDLSTCNGSERTNSPPVYVTKTRRLSRTDTSRMRDVLRKAELLILAEYTEIFVPLQYLVFMMFAFYGYNRHAFLFADIIRTEEQLYTASGWVVVLVVLDVLSTSVTAHVIKQYHDISLMRVLAFAVKEHWWLLLNFVVLMYIFVISLYLRHTGCDFTFQFSWV